MSFMGTMLGSIAGRAALPLMGVAGFGAYKSGALDGMPIPGVTGSHSHFEMQARVTKVEQHCNLRFREDGKLRQTEKLDCLRAVDLLKKPEFVGYTIHKSDRVIYSYYAPDGQSTLTGVLHPKNTPSGRSYQKNDVINIRISAKDPSKSEVI